MVPQVKTFVTHNSSFAAIITKYRLICPSPILFVKCTYLNIICKRKYKADGNNFMHHDT